MAENLKISHLQPDNLVDFGRDHSEKLQNLSRSVLSTLYMLVRSAKMYDPDNAVFDRPLMTLQDSLNAIISREGRFELMGIKNSFYINSMLVKVEFNAVDNIRYLLDELRAKDVGGFELTKSVQVAELKNFIWIFAQETAEPIDEGGLGDRRLLSIRIARWSKLKEKLDKEKLEDDQKVDRKKYAITVYARSVFFIGRYMDSVRAGKPLSTRIAVRLGPGLRGHLLRAVSPFLGPDHHAPRGGIPRLPPGQHLSVGHRRRRRARVDQSPAPRHGFHRAVS